MIIFRSPLTVECRIASQVKFLRHQRARELRAIEQHLGRGVNIMVKTGSAKKAIDKQGHSGETGWTRTGNDSPADEALKVQLILNSNKDSSGKGRGVLFRLDSY